MSLNFESWQTLADPGSSIRVDSIKWLLDDSIILGCHQVDEDGAEEGYLIQVIKSQKQKFSEIACNPTVYSFFDLFDGVWDILPSGSGPYLLTNYLDQWEAVLMSNKKAIDQHISLLKWSSTDDNETNVVALELISDKYTPKIEVPGNGDDNLVFGFCIGTVSSYEKINIKVDENIHELSPRYALFCLTSEGKLIMFHAARISEPTDLHHTLPHLDDSDVVVEKQFNINLSKESIAKPVLNDIVQIPTSKDMPKQINVEALNFQKGRVEVPGNTVSPHKQQVGTFTGQIGKFNNLNMEFVNSGNVESSVMGKGAFEPPSRGGATSSYFGSESTNKTPCGNQDETHQQSNSFIFHPTSQLANVKDFTIDVRSSTFSEKSSCTNKENLGSDVVVHETILDGKLNVSTAQSLLERIRASISQDITKQFYNVKYMTEELDILLSYIEKEGGFKDACTSYQENSVNLLEDDLWHLSEQLHSCKKCIEEQLMDVEQLQNKMLQVSARQGYMKGIVEQASNKKYWDIWNRQKLNPELEVKEQNISNTNQNLTREIIELERHFNTLEMNKFGDVGRSTLDHAAFRRSQVSSRQKPSLQSLYNTVNSQLSAAEQLSECLSRQMSDLNINSGSVEKQSIAKKLFESIGLSHEHISFQSPPVCRNGSLLPSSIRTPSSTTNSLKGYSQKNSIRLIKASEPETARRRRDSLDRNWTTFEPPKTTVKRSTPDNFSRVDKDQPFRKAKESFEAKKADFAIHQKRVQDSRSKQQVEFGSNAIPKWTKDISGSSQIESNSNPVVGTQRTFTPSLSHSFSTSSTETNLARNSASPVFTNVNFNSRNNSEMQNISGQARVSGNLSSDIASSNSLSFTGSRVQTSKNLEDSFSSSIKDNKSSSLSTTPAFALNFSENTVYSRTTAASQPNGSKSNKLESPPKLSISASFSTTGLVSTTATTPPLTSASVTSMSFGSSSFSGTSGVPTSSNSAMASTSLSIHPISSSFSSSSLTSSLSLSTSTSSESISSPVDSTQPLFSTFTSSSTAPISTVTSKPDPISVSTGMPSSNLEPVSTNSDTSEKIEIPVSNSSSSSLPKNSSNVSSSISLSQPVVSSSTTLPSSTEEKGKTFDANSSDQEDEMEEEASDATSAFNLGSLGGIGLGSTLSSTSPKQNPFGASFQTNSSNPTATSSPFALQNHPGQAELFRPASFTIPSAQPTQSSSSQPTNSGGLGGFSGFGQTSNIGAGQQALGSVLGTFGASRQIGGFPSGSGSSNVSSGGFAATAPVAAGSGFAAAAAKGGGFAAVASGGGFGGAASGGGFGGAASGGGFGGAASGGGFGGAASSGGFGGAASGGGFGGAASGGGFGGAASGGGFGGAASGGGFGGAASGGGFGAAASGGGFGGAASGGGFGAAASNSSSGFGFAAPNNAGSAFGAAGTGSGFKSDGFGGFGNNQGGGGMFSSFGGNNAASGPGKPPAALLTQMRK